MVPRPPMAILRFYPGPFEQSTLAKNMIMTFTLSASLLLGYAPDSENSRSWYGQYERLFAAVDVLGTVMADGATPLDQVGEWLLGYSVSMNSTITHLSLRGENHAFDTDMFYENARSIWRQSFSHTMFTQAVKEIIKYLDALEIIEFRDPTIWNYLTASSAQYPIDHKMEDAVKNLVMLVDSLQSLNDISFLTYCKCPEGHCGEARLCHEIQSFLKTIKAVKESRDPGPDRELRTIPLTFIKAPDHLADEKKHYTYEMKF